MREIARDVGRLEALLAFALGRLGRAEWPVYRQGRCNSQVASCLQCGRRFDVPPGDGVDRGGGASIDGGLVVADNGEEIAAADEIDLALGGALDGVLVDLVDGGAAVGLAHDARMHHAGQLHVVDEDRPCRKSCRARSSRSLLSPMCLNSAAGLRAPPRWR